HRSQAVIEFAMDGSIITANPNFLNLLGYTLAEIQGKHHRMFLTEADKNSPDYKQFWEKLNGGEFHAAEDKRLGKNQREVGIQATYNPIKGKDGKPFRVVKFASDVTDRKLRDVDFQGQVDAIGKSQAVIQFGLDGRILTANENFLRT